MKVIMSGQCIMGIVGTFTPMTDLTGKELLVGDLVRLFHFDDEGRVMSDHGLTYVADANFNSYADGSVSCSGVSNAFVMGIRNCKLGDKQSYGGYWHVKKVKRYRLSNPRKGMFTPHSIEDAEIPESFFRKDF